jgi:hydrogenase 3 maturation protease
LFPSLAVPGTAVLREVIYIIIMDLGKIRSKLSGRFSRKNKPGQPAGEHGQPSEKPTKLLKKTKKPPKDEKYLKSVSEMFREFKEVEIKKERFAVMGMGNDTKGDDGVGFYAVDKLSKEFKGDASLLFIKTSAPEDHVREIKEFAPALLIIIDAADFGKKPGSIKIIRECQISEAFVSIRTTPLALFLRLYNADQPVKDAVTIIGIQRKSSDFGQPMCGDVKKAGDMVAGVISGLYKKGTLGAMLESELERRSGAIRRIMGSLGKK